MGIVNIILVVVGLFSFAGGFFDWDWFMSQYRARALIQLVRSRRNARIFYMILGVAVAYFGIAIGLD